MRLDGQPLRALTSQYSPSEELLSLPLQRFLEEGGL